MEGFMSKSADMVATKDPCFGTEENSSYIPVYIPASTVET